MGSQEFERKLSAILSADVVGYSRLMGEDDESTVRTLSSYREVMANYIIQHKGRVVDSPGDNLLAEFTSVVNALQCAVEIQRELAERNAEIPAAQKMEYRIGVNLGDVIQEGEKIYGDGVNVTARLESLAEPGGICISGIAYDQVKKKLNLQYQFVGKKNVKNIAEPVRVYRVLSVPGAAAHRVLKAKKRTEQSWRNRIMVAVAILAVIIVGLITWDLYFRRSSIEIAFEDTMAIPTPKTPSIAILPFTNMSGDPAQDYIGDGISENIITALSMSPELSVTPSNTNFAYKAKPVKLKKVVEELGVRYVLKGSVQTSDNRLRVTAQLIDASTGNHLWSEKYDREMIALFDLQDEITKKILVKLLGEISPDMLTRFGHRSTESIDAYLKTAKGMKYLSHVSKQDNVKARHLFEQAVELDPNYASAYCVLGWTYYMDARHGWGKPRTEFLDKAFELAKKAHRLDDSMPRVYALLGQINLMQKNYDSAIAEGKRAVKLNPNAPSFKIFLAETLIYAEKPEEGLRLLKRVLALEPLEKKFQVAALFRTGIAYRTLGQNSEAIEAFKRTINLKPNTFSIYRELAACYSLLGRQEEAKAKADQFLSYSPNFSLNRYAKTILYKNTTDKERYIKALRMAGFN